MNKNIHLVSIALLAFAGSHSAAHAYEKGDWAVRMGVGSVEPKSDNGTLLAGTLDLTVDNDQKPTTAISYFITDHVAAELLVAWPFDHDFSLNGANFGSVKQLPPTVSLQYHFNPKGSVNFYIGAGFNYTMFYDENISIPGSNLQLGNSFGLAAQIGLEYFISDKWSIGAQAWWVDIDSDARLDGVDIGKAKIDPVVYGLSFSRKF